MKTECFELSDTRKNLVVEIPSAVVDAEIDRLAQRYSRAARIPGFRPGKAPRGGASGLKGRVPGHKRRDGEQR